MIIATKRSNDIYHWATSVKQFFQHKSTSVDEHAQFIIMT